MGGEDGVLLKRFRYEYGGNPAHLLTALASLAVSAWALAMVLDVLSAPGKFVIWFVGAIVLHDLVFLPLYSALGLGAGRALAGGHAPSRLRLAALNHLRVPALLSGLMFLVWFPLILSKSPQGFERLTGLSNEIYLERWLLMSAVLFGGSAILLALRVRSLRAPG